jgi:hypothetical protein
VGVTQLYGDSPLFAMGSPDRCKWQTMSCFPPNYARPTRALQFSVPLFEGVAEAVLHCAHILTHPPWSRQDAPLTLARHVSTMFPPSSLVPSQGWGLIDLPLRASNECRFIWSISSIWFVWLIGLEIHPEKPDSPERPANQTDEPERVARAPLSMIPPSLLVTS